MNLNDIDDVKKLEENQNISIISKNNMINDIKNSQTKYYILKLKNTIIGYIAFNYVFENLDLQSIVISKEHQKKGYATFLLNFLLNFAKENNISNVYLEVRRSNIKAINLYEKFGFILISTRKRYYSDNFEDALVYMKKI
jgi:ribosomal-protein-alanine N-acetyltransferase